ncbi:hypothetical protein GCM10011514_47050 [Emticicia aquatilis]|uniref:TonB C-terminal domain-containing protein n=1 Tax=Emticicia aquatilis TaxID=1537369 RepID=A0A916Z634_9BACT|nr:hypothetical protein [Emticicia aquatilis]GGD77718.1 hypothetical protein GCM10011514_47050 [Emticicia aquatilis]
MKKSFAFASLFLSLLCIESYAQAIRETIDPIFYKAAQKNIGYPIGAIRGSVYGRLYASFEVDNKGAVKNVNLIYPLVSKKISHLLGFEAEIVGGLSKTPHLNNVSEGKYILPIAFVYKNIYYGDENYPTNRISEDYFSKDFQFLKEIQITARSDQYRMLRPFSGIPPASRQIVEY